MKRILVVLLGLVLLTSVVAAAVETVTPRVYNVLLFDNATGADAAKLAIIFDQAVMFDASNIIVFGGGEPTVIAITESYAFIYVDVMKGGTLQLVLPPEYAEANVTAAFWFD
ncbi:MAG: hypothetical protein ACFFA6_17075 [Promethearchaeota archaeon]